MGVLIDSSVLIAQERGQLNLEEKLADREDSQVFVSVVTASELLHGVHRVRDAAIRARRSAFVESVLNRFPLLHVDLATARIHAELWSGQAAAGTLIGPNDLWLAATALANDLSIATGNLREFRRVPGLLVLPWLA